MVQVVPGATAPMYMYVLLSLVDTHWEKVDEVLQVNVPGVQGRGRVVDDGEDGDGEVERVMVLVEMEVRKVVGMVEWLVNDGVLVVVVAGRVVNWVVLVVIEVIVWSVVESVVIVGKNDAVVVERVEKSCVVLFPVVVRKPSLVSVLV